MRKKMFFDMRRMCWRCIYVATGSDYLYTGLVLIALALILMLVYWGMV